MRHVSRISKSTPAPAFLLLRRPGIFGLNELGDVVLILGAFVQTAFDWLLGDNWWPAGVGKSGYM